jgi:hypothetical protein
VVVFDEIVNICFKRLRLFAAWILSIVWCFKKEVIKIKQQTVSKTVRAFLSHFASRTHLCRLTTVAQILSPKRGVLFAAYSFNLASLLI